MLHITKKKVYELMGKYIYNGPFLKSSIFYNIYLNSITTFCLLFFAFPAQESLR
jgi:hypothetical protein